MPVSLRKETVKMFLKRLESAAQIWNNITFDDHHVIV